MYCNNMIIFLLLILLNQICIYPQYTCYDDTRIPSNNPAIGRVVGPNGAMLGSCWIAQNGKIVTAGHVINGDPYSCKVQFNVYVDSPEPLQRNTYTIVPYSYIEYYDENNPDEGNDWAVFKAINNDDPLNIYTPIQEQNSYLKASLNINLTNVTIARITGHGWDSPLTPPNYDLLQQTAIGLKQSGSGPSKLVYQIYTNHICSGGPIIDEETGYVIGIITASQCLVDVTYSMGTSIFNTGFWNALGLEEFEVYADQQRENNTRLTGTSIDSWDPFSQSFSINTISNAPLNFNIFENDELVLRGYQEVVQSPSEKYNQWNIFDDPADDVTNHHKFIIENDQLQLTSKFKKTYSGTTIKNSLEGTSIDGGSVKFKDPWFIDYSDPDYGNTLRNGGMDQATWWNRISPFYPNSTITFENGHQNGQKYNGVFLNQDYIDPGKSYYTVKADAEQTIPVNGQNRKFYFLNWTGDVNKVEFQDSMAVQTGVVFKDANAMVSAKLKGNLVSGQTDAYSSNSQQKTIRDNNGYYHTVYISMGMPWYTKSVTTDFGGNWSQDIPLITYNGTAKNAAIDFYDNNLLVVYEYNQTEGTTGTFLQLVMIDMTSGSITNYEYGKISIPSNSFGGAKPVIAYTNGEIYVAYKESTSSTLKFWRNYQDGLGQWQTASGNIPNATSNSINVTLASRDFPNDIHLAWQERTSTGTANSIKYIYSNLSGTARNYSSFTTISGGSGFIHNLNPSISYYSSGGSRYPIVSWTGKEDEGPASQTVVRPKSSSVWGSLFITGANVNNTVNQSVTNSDNTVIAWSENNGSSSKYAKRINAQYSCVGKVLSNYGTDVSLSGGNSLSQIKALVFKGTGTPPYLINKSTTDFSSTCIIEQGALSKITANDTIVTFGRSGVVSINDIEFIFEIGDILVGDSIIKFIEIPDTLAYNSANELNQHTRTNNFTLTPETNFYFSNIYHVVQKSNPDTAITTLDAVNFKAELINALTDQVVGTFDNITYNKNNLEKYANIDYEVDCSGITAGEYYLRLVTNVNCNASYTLANIYNDNITLAKKNFNKVNFSGSEIPTTYDLAQNFPNPFNPSTTIRYQIPQDGIVTLKIYDILGSEVATLVNEEKVAGKYEVNFNASSLASGVYIYKIQSISFVNSKKMILLK